MDLGEGWFEIGEESRISRQPEERQKQCMINIAWEINIIYPLSLSLNIAHLQQVLVRDEQILRRRRQVQVRDVFICPKPKRHRRLGKGV